MAILPIVTFPDERLSSVCAPVGGVDDAVLHLAQDMLDTMYDAYGRGLAAPQVGVLQRVFVMDLSWKDGTRVPQVCIDPVISWWSDYVVPGPEGCLSIPGVTADVPRATAIHAVWTSPDGVRREHALTGFAAICVQHELDHLNGIVTFDRLSPAARQVVEASYTVRCAP